MNRPLSEGYYLKEQLREIWRRTDRKEAGRFSEKAKCPADEDGSAVMVYRIGILAWYDCNISTGKVEGINNKIKVMKRTAYGFRDERYLN